MFRSRRPLDRGDVEMRKGVLASVVMVLLGALLLNPASAAVKAGTSCTKLNQKTTSAGYTYTCIKSGKKLVWSKGVKVVSPNPIPSSTPSPTPTPTPIPTPQASAQATPLFPISSDLILPSNLHSALNDSGILLNWDYSAVGKVQIEFYRIHGACTNSTNSCGSYVYDLWTLPTSEKAIISYQIKLADLGTQASGGEWKFWVGANNQTVHLSSPEVGFDPVTLTTIATATPTPTSFSDLLANASGIPRAAWDSYNAKLKAAAAVPVIQNIFVGPNSTLINPSVSQAFTTGTKIFSGFTQPQSFFAIYYSFSDVQWAKSKVSELGFPNRAVEIDGSCSSATQCNGASAGKASNTAGFGQFALPGSNGQDIYHLRGGIELHEYTHMVQAMQFVGKPTDAQGFGNLPQWFTEGHAHIIGNLASTSTFEEYKAARAQWLNTSPNAAIKSFSPANIQAFYDALMPGKYNSDLFGYVYTVGFLTLEQLVAIKGVDSPMQLVLEVSNGLSFEQAFKKVYGVEWSEAEPILAQVVSKELS